MNARVRISEVPAPVSRRARLRQVGFAFFLTAVFGAPLVGVTVLRDAPPVIHAVLLPLVVLLGVGALLLAIRDLHAEHDSDRGSNS
jgi:hypothetical protein